MKRLLPLAIAGAVVSASAVQALAEWKPAGPITLNIGFKAGGGTDTQARLIGEELSAKKRLEVPVQERCRQGRLQPCARTQRCQQ